MSDPELPRAIDDVPDPFADELASAPIPALPDFAASPAPTRAEVRARRAIAAIVAIAWEIAIVAVMGPRRDLHALSPLAFALGLAAPLAAAAIALFVARRRGRAGLGASKGWLGAAIVVAFALFAMGAVATSAVAGVVAEPSWRANLGCAATSTLLAAGPLVFVAIAFVHAFASRAILRTTALGVACGALAGAAIHVHCASDAPVHVLAGHGFAMVLGGLVGAAIARVTRA